MPLRRILGRLAALLLAAAAWSGLPAAPAQALVTFGACPLYALDDVTPSLGCSPVHGTTQNTAETMNTAPGLFALTGWEPIVKSEFLVGGGLSDTFFGDWNFPFIDTADGSDSLSGAFALDPALWAANEGPYRSIAFVMKSGSPESTSPACIIGYLITPSATSGTYTSPFRCEKDPDQVKEISNFAVYGNVEGGGNVEVVVPVPAAAPLLLTALGGLALWRRRA